MPKLPLALLGFLIFLFSGLSAQPTGALKNKQSEPKSNAVAKKPIREYVQYDTIYSSFPRMVEGIKLMNDRTIKDTRYNIYSISEKTEEVMKLEPLDQKFKIFGWNVINADGHNMEEIFSAFEKASQHTGSPTLIVFKTVLGKGVSYMENNPKWHGTPPNKEQEALALAELS